jgi:hypothetical protein
VDVRVKFKKFMVSRRMRRSQGRLKRFIQYVHSVRIVSQSPIFSRSRHLEDKSADAVDSQRLCLSFIRFSQVQRFTLLLDILLPHASKKDDAELP